MLLMSDEMENFYMKMKTMKFIYDIPTCIIYNGNVIKDTIYAFLHILHAIVVTCPYNFIFCRYKFAGTNPWMNLPKLCLCFVKP